VFIVTDGDVMLTDGVNWKSVAQGRVRDYLFSQLDQASYENLFVVHHRSRNEVWLCYPATGNTYCSEAIVYNVATDAWGVRALSLVTHIDVGVVNDEAADESWDVDAEAWDADLSIWNSANFSLAVEQIIVAAASANLLLEDTDDATTRAASVFKYDLTMDAPERQKFVRRLHVRTNETAGTLYCRVGARNSVTEAITWDTERTLVAGQAFVNVRALGRYISVELRSQDDDLWQVTGFDLEYEFRGYIGGSDV
jgi:hypothetical protein